MLGRIRLLTVSLFLLVSFNSHSEAHKIDWNDSALNWQSYEQGMKLLDNPGSVGILIFYGDWCLTCMSYSKLFADKAVVASLKDIVLIRVNVDAQSDISDKYDFDGDYVPRTFALGSKGKILKPFHPDRKSYTYFLPAESRDLTTRLNKDIQNSTVV
jgi:thiol-disulfide isomerase/thioredoxin